MFRADFLKFTSKFVQIWPYLLCCSPLYWLERDRPDFFEQHTSPFLLKHTV